MLFRNLTLFRLAAAAVPTPAALAEALDAHRLRPCGPLEATTRGAVPPLATDEDAPLVQNLGDYSLLCIGQEDKLLPAAVVNQELTRRARKAAAKKGHPVGGRERKRLRAEVLDELLPRAFARPSRLNVCLDRKRGWLVLDTASRKAAEDTLTALRHALGSLPAVPLAPRKPARQLMTQWLTTGKLPADLALGDECELRDPASAAGARVRCLHQVLESDEIREHLRTGKQAYQLGLEFGGRTGFVLGEDLVVRKLRFFDIVTEQLDSLQDTSAEAELEARFALVTGELEHLLGKFETWFGLPRPDAA